MAPPSTLSRRAALMRALFECDLAAVDLAEVCRSLESEPDVQRVLNSRGSHA